MPGSRATREYLQGKVEEVEGKLRQARGERRETDRDRHMAEAVANLKRTVAGAAPPCLSSDVPSSFLTNDI